MWAILGMYAVQKTIDNNNNKCSDCEEVPDLEVIYTHGRKVMLIFIPLFIPIYTSEQALFMFTGLLYCSLHIRC